MVQVKSGTGRATHEEKENLKLWGVAFHGTAEIWRYRKGRSLQKEVVFKYSR
jgi:hypothetical protein